MKSEIFGLEAGLRVVVTAGAAGIGHAIAEAFYKAGAQVYVCDISQEALDACAKDYPDWIYMLCDVSNKKQVAQMFGDVETRLGGLDILINNAGIAGPTASVDEIHPDAWDQTIAINLNGQFYCTHYAVPMLKKSDNASIICISSIAGRLAYANRTPYAATKWAIRGFAESLAVELGPEGIRVNTILPGIVEGPRIENVIRARADAEGVTYETMESSYKNMSSLGRMVSADDIAAQALFLCSSFGRNISGQSINIDGHVRAL